MRALLLAALLIAAPGCGTLLGQRAETAGVALGMCVAACAATCVSEVLTGGSAGARAERYGLCMAPCAAECLPASARVFVRLPNPPPRCRPVPAEDQLKQPPPLEPRDGQAQPRSRTLSPGG